MDHYIAGRIKSKVDKKASRAARVLKLGMRFLASSSPYDLPVFKKRQEHNYNLGKNPVYPLPARRCARDEVGRPRGAKSGNGAT